MSDLGTGGAKLRTTQHALQFMKELYKIAQECLADVRAFNQFAESLQQTDPKHPVMDEYIATLYSTKGKSVEKTRD